MLYKGTLQIIKERREEKQGRKGKAYHLSADFRRRAWRDKKAFFNEQCIKLEENNRRGKTRDLFRKIGKSREHFAQR